MMIQRAESHASFYVLYIEAKIAVTWKPVGASVHILRDTNVSLWSKDLLEKVIVVYLVSKFPYF